MAAVPRLVTALRPYTAEVWAGQKAPVAGRGAAVGNGRRPLAGREKVRVWMVEKHAWSEVRGERRQPEATATAGVRSDRKPVLQA